MSIIEGLCVPVSLPLDEGYRFDQVSYEKHLHNLAEAGVDSLLINGLTGQNYCIDTSTRRSVFNCAVSIAPELKKIQPDLKVFACVNGESFTETLNNIKYLNHSGYDAIVVQPSRLAEKDVVYFTTLMAEASLKPVILYSNSATALGKEGLADPSVMAELSKAKNIKGAKVSEQFETLERLCQADTADGFCFAAGNALDMFRAVNLKKVVGVVSGPANIFPREWKQAFDQLPDQGFKVFFEHVDRTCGLFLIPAMSYILYKQGFFSSPACLAGKLTEEQRTLLDKMNSEGQWS